MTNHDFLVDAVARYAPTQASIDAEWNASARVAVLADIVGTDAEGAGNVYTFPLQFVPSEPARRSRSVRYLMAGSVAAVVAAAAVVVVVIHPTGSAGHRSAATGTEFILPPGLSDVALTAGQVSYSVRKSFPIDTPGAPVVITTGPTVDGQTVVGPGGSSDNWISQNGTLRSIRTSNAGGPSNCLISEIDGSWTIAGSTAKVAPSAATQPNTGDPSLAYFASLPTVVDQLNAKLGPASGSTSKDLFGWVGENLGAWDGLVSPRLRAALVAVMSLAPGITVVQNVPDYLGRTSVRVDYDGGSLYFDPTTFQLTEQLTAPWVVPNIVAPPSGVSAGSSYYVGNPPTKTLPAEVNLMVSETVLDSLPPLPTICKSGLNHEIGGPGVVSPSTSPAGS